MCEWNDGIYFRPMSTLISSPIYSKRVHKRKKQNLNQPRMDYQNSTFFIGLYIYIHSIIVYRCVHTNGKKRERYMAHICLQIYSPKTDRSQQKIRMPFPKNSAAAWHLWQSQLCQSSRESRDCGMVQPHTLTRGTA